MRIRYLASCMLAAACIAIAPTPNLQERFVEEQSYHLSPMQRWQREVELYSFVDSPDPVWHSPTNTKESRRGDCKDFAALSCAEYPEYGTKVIMLWGFEAGTMRTVGHMVHLLEKDGKYGSMDFLPCNRLPPWRSGGRTYDTSNMK